MSGSKYFERVAWSITALVLAVTILFMNGNWIGIAAMERTMGYESRLFDATKVHSIDIVMDDWDTFIANATSEEYYAANVVIDGEAYKNVGIRAKGNTSLSTVASLGSERYSFKIEFDHYDSTKSYYGLDKLSLNNLIQDSTMMKDYLVYTMMNEFGVNSSLCSYVYITVNGEDWGLYVAVEGVEEAFLERNYGSNYGELYKPDSMSFGGGRGNGGDFDINDLGFDFGGNSQDGSGSGDAAGGWDPSAIFGGGQPPNMPSDMPSFEGSETGDGGSPAGIPEDFDPSEMFGGGGFSFGMGSSDVKLQYIDDELDSYSNIWNNAKTDITEADQRRLIASLKKLSANEEIESVVDVEQVIRYFVVHNYVCNDDSYTGMMVHNYYLYEKDGQLAMIPWDYNLSFGTFSAMNATSTVNTPIDSPVSGGSSDRPMLNWIFEDEEYTALYHQYFAEFLSSVDIQGIIDDAYNLIKSYVAKDPTAFYTYEEFELGVETLRQFCSMRSESISLQLENGETTENMSYVDASGITLSDMGSMSGMGGFGGDRPSMPGGMEGFDGADFGNAPGTEVPDNASAQAAGQNGTATSEPSTDAADAAPQEAGEDAAQDAPTASAGNAPDGFDFSGLPKDFDPSSLPEEFSGGFSAPPSSGQTETTPAADSATAEDAGASRPSGGGAQGPDGAFRSNWTGTSSSSQEGWIWIGASAAILAIGLIIAKKYKS